MWAGLRKRPRLKPRAKYYWYRGVLRD